MNAPLRPQTTRIHTDRRWLAGLGALLLLLLTAVGCAAPAAGAASLSVQLSVDGEVRSLALPPASTISDALSAAGVTLNPLDRVEPPSYTRLEADTAVRVVRVSEKFEVVQDPIPFEHQVLHNESLAADRQVFVQRGQNGLQEITYRRIFEDGQEVSKLPVKTVVLTEAQPEILMLGVQAPFFPVQLSGRLVYLRDSNAWVMDGDTNQRRAVVTSGDLDGRVFRLSDDGSWLLFTRASARPAAGEVDDQEINRLWLVDVTAETPEPVDLNVANVVHFADWLPGSNTKIVFSTVEPRSTAPGWQANNDLYALTLSQTGWTTKWATLIEPNSGGVYGWWGVNFLWRPSGEAQPGLAELTILRPDGLATVNYADGVVSERLALLPYQTGRDWAWVTGATWSPDGSTLYFMNHTAAAGAASPEQSPQFDLAALPASASRPLTLASQTGMFAYPLASPTQPHPGSSGDFQLAYLQAAFPDQSATSRYRVALMDRDGSGRKLLFPAAGLPGLEAQDNWGAWSPAPLPESGNFALAVIYAGNLWLVDTRSGAAQQVTSDGLTSRLAWK